jgi:hypothetical protein
VRHLISPLPNSDFKPHPPAGTMQYKNVMDAYKKCKVNPFLRPVIIDANSSTDKFKSSKVDMVPTITRSRGCQKDGYWCSTKGGSLSVHELSSLQGYHEIFGTKIDFEAMGISHCQFGGMLGNAQSGTILLLLYPRVLYHAGVITIQEYRSCNEKLEATFKALGSIAIPLV